MGSSGLRWRVLFIGSSAGNIAHDTDYGRGTMSEELPEGWVFMCVECSMVSTDGENWRWPTSDEAFYARFKDGLCVQHMPPPEEEAA